MLGATIVDPDGIEGPAESIEGLGYLPVNTRLAATKRIGKVSGADIATGAAFEGYEIHLGRTDVDPAVDRMLRFADGSFDGARSVDGRVAGCYVHGLFNDGNMRTAWLRSLDADCDGAHQSARVDEALDDLAKELEQAMDLDRLLAVARQTS
jgi:adenosylcobyric acid synthase